MHYSVLSIFIFLIPAFLTFPSQDGISPLERGQCRHIEYAFLRVHCRAADISFPFFTCVTVGFRAAFRKSDTSQSASVFVLRSFSNCRVVFRNL